MASLHLRKTAANGTVTYARIEGEVGSSVPDLARAAGVTLAAGDQLAIAGIGAYSTPFTIPADPTVSDTLADLDLKVGDAVSVDVSFMFTGTGMTYALATTSAALPDGLSLSTAGRITGTATTATPARNIVVRGADAFGRNVYSFFAITVAAASTAPAVAFPKVTDYNIDTGLTYNFSAYDAVLPNWGQGPMSVGTPSLVEFQTDGSALLKAERRTAWPTDTTRSWYTGALQFLSPAHAIGRAGADVHVTDPAAVAAFFAYAGNSKEIDFELTIANGVIGWAPTVHMPKTGGGSVASSLRTMARAPYANRIQRLEYELFADRCEFRCDGVLFETIRPADMAAGYIWDTTTKMNLHFAVEEHGTWAGWNYASGHAAMRVYGVTSDALGAVVAPPPAPVTAGRMAVQTQSYNERPNVVPQTFYDAGMNELADPNAHPMITGFTHVAIKSGRWTDPGTWSTGSVPGANAIVSLGQWKVTYDAFSDVLIRDIFGPIGSWFTIDKTKDTRLRVDTVMLMGVSERIVDVDSSVPGRARFEVVFHQRVAPLASARFGWMDMGPLRELGVRKTNYLRAAHLAGQTAPTIPQGATSVSLPGLDTSGWRVGDTVVLLGTGYVPTTTTDPHYTQTIPPGPTSYYGYSRNAALAQHFLNEYQPNQDEQRVITAISGTTISWATPLQFEHAGAVGTLDDGQPVKISPVVAHLNRSILFRTATAAEDGAIDPSANHAEFQRRAHWMAMRHADVDVRYSRHRNMGRTSTDPSLLVADLPYKATGVNDITAILTAAGGAPLANPNNVRGRYAYHFHWCGGPYKGSPLIACVGCVADADVGAMPQPGWAMVQHGTRMAWEDAVIVNARGAGMVSELGLEIGQWVNNVSTGCRGDGEVDVWGSRAELYTNHNDSMGAAFGNQSRAIKMHGNIAGGSKYGYIWHAQKDHGWLRSLRDVDMPFTDGITKGSAVQSATWQDEYVGAQVQQIPPMLDNEVHGCRFGFNVIHRNNNSLFNGADKTPMLIEGLLTVGTPFPWGVPNYSNTYYMKDCFFVGPLNAMTDSVAFHLGNQTWDWNINNCLMRNFAIGVNGAGAHINYEGHFCGLKFENVTTQFNNPYLTLPTGVDRASHPQRNIMGDVEDHPTIANQLIPRRYFNRTRSFFPHPGPKSPYGPGPTQPNGQPWPVVAYGDKPIFIPGPSMNTTLTMGNGRNQGSVGGFIVDFAGPRKTFDYQFTDPYPSQISVKGNRSLGKMTPEQLVQRWGCWLDGTQWRSRAWWPMADRLSHAYGHYYIDFALNNCDPDFMALHAKAGPGPEPEWPFKLEAVAAPRPLTPLAKGLAFRDRVRIEAVSGLPLAHRLRANEVGVRRTITGGPDAAQFAISGDRLTWAGNGTRSRTTAQDANGDHVYEVDIGLGDAWGNGITTRHTVTVIPSARVVASIEDSFDRADENLAGANVVQLSGSPGAFAVRSNALAAMVTSVACYDLGSLGTSEQEVSVVFRSLCDAFVLMRMVDQNNWLGFRRRSSQLQVYQCVAGVQTLLATFLDPSASLPVTLKATGRKLVVVQEGSATSERLIRYPTNQPTAVIKLLDLDPLAEPGSLLLPANTPMGTNVGLLTGATTANPWIDGLAAKPVNAPFTVPASAPAVVSASGNMVLSGRKILKPNGFELLGRGPEFTVSQDSDVAMMDTIDATGANYMRLLLGLAAPNARTPANLDAVLARCRLHKMPVHVSLYVWNSPNYEISAALGGGNFYQGTMADFGTPDASTNPYPCYLNVWDRQWLKDLVNKYRDIVIIDAMQEYKSPSGVSPDSQAGRDAWASKAIQMIQWFRGRGYTQPLEIMGNFQGRDLYGITQKQASIRAADTVLVGGQPQTMFGWQAYWEPSYYKTYQGSLFGTTGGSLTSAAAIGAHVATAAYPIQVGFDNYGGDMGSEYPANMAAAANSGVSWLWWDWRNGQLDTPLGGATARNYVLNDPTGFIGAIKE